jgi:hypothetical protein
MWAELTALVHAALVLAAPPPTHPAPTTPSYVEAHVPKAYRAYVRCSERATRELLEDVPPLRDAGRSKEHMERMRELAGEVQQRCGAMLPEGAGYGAGPVDVIVG